MKSIEYEIKRAELRDTERMNKDASYDAEFAAIKVQLLFFSFIDGS